MQVLLEITKFHLHESVPGAGIIRNAGIIPGSALYEVIRYPKEKSSVIILFEFLYLIFFDQFGRIFNPYLTNLIGQSNSKLYFQPEVSSKKMNEQIQLYYFLTCFHSLFGRK